MIFFGVNKVVVIKVVCEIIGFGLKEVKDMVEGVFLVFKEVVFKEEVEEFKKKFEEIGVIIIIK